MTHPVAGYLFPAYDAPEYDVDAIIAELAEAEADAGTDAYDEAAEYLGCLPEWELIARYADHRSEY